MAISRREFVASGAKAGIGWSLASGLSLGGALSLLPTAARAAATKSDRFFVLLRVAPGFGGLDVSLGLDPWTKPTRPAASDMFIEYRDDELIQAGALTFGPAAAPLAPYADRLLVLNGVMMSEFDNGHLAAINYISTGNGQGKAPDLPVELGSIGGVGPYGIVTTFTLTTAGRKVPFVRGSDVLNSLLTPDPADALEKAIKGSPRSPLERAVGEVIAAKEITKKLRDQLEAFGEAGMSLGDTHATAACFLAGAACQAQIDLRPNGNLDTHANHEGTHLASQKEAWGMVKDVFDIFKSIPWQQTGESLFDRTTFMVVSDFARMPALNGAKGKDHNPMTNSVLFAGAGIQTGKTVGTSLLIEATRSKSGNSYHMAAPLDMATGLPATSRQGAEFIYPENVVMTAAAIMDLDLSKVRSAPANTKVIPGIKRT